MNHQDDEPLEPTMNHDEWPHRLGNHPEAIMHALAIARGRYGCGVTFLYLRYTSARSARRLLCA